MAETMMGEDDRLITPTSEAVLETEGCLNRASLSGGPLFSHAVPRIFNEGHIAVAKLSPAETQHHCYFEERGARDGCPIVILHGGPGNPIPEEVLGIFGGESIRAIIPHQRGAGRSYPQGEMSGNSTKHLLLDLEQLREHLGIENWHVFGWSWGTTLGFAYAEAYPERTRSITGFGTYLGTKEEDDYCLAEIARTDPATYQKYLEISPREHCEHYAQGFLEMLATPRFEEAIRVWFDIAPECKIPEALRERANISIGYFAKGCFLDKNQIVDQLNRIRGIPITLVHGTNDPYCPVSTVGKLRELMQGAATVKVLDPGSHSLSEAGVQAYLYEHFCSLTK